MSSTLAVLKDSNAQIYSQWLQHPTNFEKVGIYRNQEVVVLSVDNSFWQRIQWVVLEFFGFISTDFNYVNSFLQESESQLISLKQKQVNELTSRIGHFQTTETNLKAQVLNAETALKPILDAQERANSKLTDTQKSVEKAKKQVETLFTKYTVLTSNVEGKEKQLNELNGSLAELTKQLEDLKKDSAAAESASSERLATLQQSYDEVFQSTSKLNDEVLQSTSKLREQYDALDVTLKTLLGRKTGLEAEIARSKQELRDIQVSHTECIMIEMFSGNYAGLFQTALTVARFNRSPPNMELDEMVGLAQDVKTANDYHNFMEILHTKNMSKKDFSHLEQEALLFAALKFNREWKFEYEDHDDEYVIIKENEDCIWREKSAISLNSTPQNNTQALMSSAERTMTASANISFLTPPRGRSLLNSPYTTPARSSQRLTGTPQSAMTGPVLIAASPNRPAVDARVLSAVNSNDRAQVTALLLQGMAPRTPVSSAMEAAIAMGLAPLTPLAPPSADSSPVEKNSPERPALDFEQASLSQSPSSVDLADAAASDLSITRLGGPREAPQVSSLLPLPKAVQQVAEEEGKEAVPAAPLKKKKGTKASVTQNDASVSQRNVAKIKAKVGSAK